MPSCYCLASGAAHSISGPLLAVSCSINLGYLYLFIFEHSYIPLIITRHLLCLFERLNGRLNFAEGSRSLLNLVRTPVDTGRQNLYRSSLKDDVLTFIQEKSLECRLEFNGDQLMVLPTEVSKSNAVIFLL